MSPRTDPRARRARPAFTLVEAVMAMAITGIIIGGMAGALVMTVRAVDGGEDNNLRAVRAAEAADALAADLSVATAFTERTATAVTFRVPDRDGDGAEDSLRYSWSAVAGAGLVRQFKTNASAVLAEDVHGFAVSFVDRPPPTLVESSERVIASFAGDAGASTPTVGINASTSAAQYVRPSLPAGTSFWKITRVRLPLQMVLLAGGSIRVRIVEADGSRKPTGTVLAERTVSAGSLPLTFLLGLHEVTLGPVAGLSPSTGVCIVVQHASGSGQQATLEYQQKSTGLPFNTHYAGSTDGGANWTTPNDTQDMRFEVIGTTSSYQ